MSTGKWLGISGILLIMMGGSYLAGYIISLIGLLQFLSLNPSYYWVFQLFSLINLNPFQLISSIAIIVVGIIFVLKLGLNED